ncbi:TPA: flagellar hook-associated protein FlgK [Legionella pneumophila subsp. pneumophila]|uniref:Flagellar hook-associated protein 1 n=1 Tax=Legionella pneumophila (strain Lens) TaxID=297245 RepID=Q5WX65_LEGPL|nr:flagellar hook-associated protein FlgK [Legionella pneumophila]AOW52171.1 flagellar hook-associated protein FlgK [Legionella pneumophila subsp. pneumophila]AOW54240.1 flagellar hook-associated protein FlgK [Legionella pneumophila subsp. pneumophila]AOW57469.1 flagellar hook-associated protein FlgK [Legionella pneumophila subsp. pneumophila]AOW62353.1 flagellar hook-associated protein FlgK [Legionella pneumophila subsp. pneumophila]AOW62966.1 flagellar hook-associated protein FlgK [Legionell
MSILNIAYSGLNAFQRALDVTGNNIANFKTRGYSRQSIQFTPIASNRYAGSYIGAGVSVSSIYRNVDQFANAQVRSTLSYRTQYDAFYNQAIQIDKLLSQDGSSISAPLQTFFDSIGQLNSTPDNIATRGVVLKQSQLLAQQFNSLQIKLEEYERNSTLQVTESVKIINRITKELAEVNGKLLGNNNIPELLDHRDELLKQLSGYTDLSIFDQGDGTISVGIASGDMLVAGTQQRDLVVGTGKDSIFGTKIFLSSGGNNQVDITDRLTTGMLGGLIDYEKNVLGQASQLIGQMAIGLAQTFNTQHKLGIDMNSQIGKDFFTDFNSPGQMLKRSRASADNSGTAVLSVNISDISQVKLSDYDLIISDTGANELRLIRKSDGTSTTLTWSSSPPAPPAGQVVIDGMTITVNDLSQLANNDHYTLTPTRGAARDFALEIKDAYEIALASPVKTTASLNNTGQGQIILGPVLNTASVNKQFRIDFISDTQYNLVNVTDSTTAGPFAFVPNTNNVIQIPDGITPSYSVVLSGIPKSGDQFTTDYNTGGFGDNRNGLILGNIQQNKIFSNGSETLFDRYGSLLAEVGGRTNQAKTSFESADILHKQALDFQDSKSGVNLDEEGANLLVFQQAYQAAGKLMEISNQIMNLLFDIMR